MDPSNPDVLYASMWQFRRKPFAFASGGPGSALYKVPMAVRPGKS